LLNLLASLYWRLWFSNTGPMPTPPVALRTTFWSIVPSPELKALAASKAECLAPFHKLVSLCKLEAGLWHLHQRAGQIYRVTIELALETGGVPLYSKVEAAMGDAAADWPALISAAFDDAVGQLRGVLALQGARASTH
jgi:hypothetical protein